MTLLLKLLLAPLLVVASSLAGRRWGDRVTGVLVAFPIVAGPILLITCLEQGVEFGARAAAASLLGLVSLAVFSVVFTYAARRWRWPAALAVSWAATGIADVALAGRNLAAGWALLLVAAAIVAGRWLLAAVHDGTADGGRVRPPWWDLPGRAIATAALVLFVTGIAATAGPVVTGILAPFPIATSVVAAFVHAQQGPAAVARTMTGVLQGLAGFAVFCFLASVLLVPLGVGGAFAAAVAGVPASQAVVMLATARRRSPVSVHGSRRG
ncbi:hypothetical protein Q0Z83_046580 [Actinoplanes sichuanensis]|uniref:Uncharacterized protein n=1 Tax=Actinoplanes sichuanensis TaxID=512349 RepID=A0ABW4A9Y5_9ACTN|nr:hypothetical protein [Actinoplanes sichuanensis]BEL06467.1 hypothetical protein Q0Z83_046580 [Actinoplanes sichuanensis]